MLMSKLNALFAENANLFVLRKACTNKMRAGLDAPPSKTKNHPTGWRFAWWSIKDSNLGPTGYEPVALTN